MEIFPPTTHRIVNEVYIRFPKKGTKRIKDGRQSRRGGSGVGTQPPCTGTTETEVAEGARGDITYLDGMEVRESATTFAQSF